MSQRILVIEDEVRIQRIIRAFLEDAGYTVTVAGDGAQGIARYNESAFDLVLLDIMMPEIDGFKVCEEIRKKNSTPIIIISALDSVTSQMKGFDLQADDYITKPFVMPLVLKRIEAVLRRSDGMVENNEILNYKQIKLDIKEHKVYVSDHEIILTAREFEILRLFMENPGRVFTRENVVNQIWNYDFYGDERIVNTHIKNIRKKVGCPCIETIRGVGYKLNDKAD